MCEKEFRKIGVIELRRNVNGGSDKDVVKAVKDYFNSRVDKTDSDPFIDENDIFVVWQCKVLQNNKALLSTTVSDGMYYEFTWNGDKNEGYLDVYKKWENVVIKK